MLENSIEASDGLIEVDRVMQSLPFSLAVLPEGPRQWQPTDFWAEIEDDVFYSVKTSYKAMQDRFITLISAPENATPETLIKREAIQLVFAYLRKENQGHTNFQNINNTVGDISFSKTQAAWQVGRCSITNPIRFGYTVNHGLHITVSQGLSEPEFLALLDTVFLIDTSGEESKALDKRRRKVLSEQWLKAPRVPLSDQEFFNR